MQRSYTIYRPGALLGLAGGAIALAGLFFLPLATVYLPSTHESTPIGTRQVTELSLMTSNVSGVGNALIAFLIIATTLLLTINLIILTRQLSPRLIISGRILSLMGAITQAILCLLILFSTAITPASSRGPVEVISTHWDCSCSSASS